MCVFNCSASSTISLYLFISHEIVFEVKVCLLKLFCFFTPKNPWNAVTIETIVYWYRTLTWATYYIQWTGNEPPEHEWKEQQDDAGAGRRLSRPAALPPEPGDSGLKRGLRNEIHEERIQQTLQHEKPEREAVRIEKEKCEKAFSVLAEGWGKAVLWLCPL